MLSLLSPKLSDNLSYLTVSYSVFWARPTTKEYIRAENDTPYKSETALKSPCDSVITRFVLPVGHHPGVRVNRDSCRNICRIRTLTLCPTLPTPMALRPVCFVLGVDFFFFFLGGGVCPTWKVPIPRPVTFWTVIYACFLHLPKKTWTEYFLTG